MKKIVLAAAMLACLAATPALADTYTGTGFAILNPVGATPSTATSTIAVNAPGTVQAVSSR